MPIDTPEQVMHAFASCLETRDLEGLVALYEADATLVMEAGIQPRGHTELREAFRELLSIKPSLELTATEVFQASDLTLVVNRWRLRGSAPDGTPIEKSGQSSVVLRRQAQGGFRIVIDRP